MSPGDAINGGDEQLDQAIRPHLRMDAELELVETRNADVLLRGEHPSARIRRVGADGERR